MIFFSLLGLKINAWTDELADCQNGLLTQDSSNNRLDSLSASKVLNPDHRKIWAVPGENLVFFLYKDCLDSSKREHEAVLFDKNYRGKTLIEFGLACNFFHAQIFAAQKWELGFLSYGHLTFILSCSEHC